MKFQLETLKVVGASMVINIDDGYSKMELIELLLLLLSKTTYVCNLLNDLDATMILLFP